eukprot:CAMPEP_0194413974 /NCGR_PEP_ID=MMETSP0176-20130528/12518_1 /TAXON_ID=216777 /ORGANISM="Proboscia alata, Strain PI-D3" /LENGTH=78 /DNA_ID=CAMNT_0039217599 /DNA_START=64 /DNA_END=296 /DNA_ORIENTATION=+
MDAAPPAPSAKSTELTMAFSSTMTAHSVQIEAPLAAWVSISWDPQLGHWIPPFGLDMEVALVLALVEAGAGVSKMLSS